MPNPVNITLRNLNSACGTQLDSLELMVSINSAPSPSDTAYKVLGVDDTSTFIDLDDFPTLIVGDEIYYGIKSTKDSNHHFVTGHFLYRDAKIPVPPLLSHYKFNETSGDYIDLGPAAKNMVIEGDPLGIDRTVYGPLFNASKLVRLTRDPVITGDQSIYIVALVKIKMWPRLVKDDKQIFGQWGDNYDSYVFRVYEDNDTGTYENDDVIGSMAWSNSRRNAVQQVKLDSGLPADTPLTHMEEALYELYIDAPKNEFSFAISRSVDAGPKEFSTFTLSPLSVRANTATTPFTIGNRSGSFGWEYQWDGQIRNMSIFNEPLGDMSIYSPQRMSMFSSGNFAVNLEDLDV